MQIVIDIPEILYTKIQNGKADKRTIETVILHGTPLPKGHGRLIDGEAVWKKLKALEDYYQTECTKESSIVHDVSMHSRLYGFTNSKFIVQDAPTIIEAESEV